MQAAFLLGTGRPASVFVLNCIDGLSTHAATQRMAVTLDGLLHLPQT